MKANERGSEWRIWDLHVHTASSYDASYKGDDYNKLLIESLSEKKVSAVAITDHFYIDAKRIQDLRGLAPEITFFPGVELRIDTLGANTHVIIIFSEEKDLKILEEDFNSIMIREKSKPKNSNDENIHWGFNDVVEFAKKRGGLISIHAGNKTNGIDKMTNALPTTQAIKVEVTKHVDFFEVARLEDLNVYEDIVFKHIDRKPLILCSDNHNPKMYSTREKLWIKGDTTFDGLLQTIYHPKERVYIGDVPPQLEKANNNKRNYIESIKIERKEEPDNEDYTWFDFDLPINKGLTTIIGNKGSGKSALSDIIGHLCKCKEMDKASFLNENRFRKLPKNYAKDYVGKLKWLDEHEDIEMNLGEEEYETTIQSAQYLPQKYIEDVCNSLDDEFNNEINKLIFSYVDDTEKGEAIDLTELIKHKSAASLYKLSQLEEKISDVNEEIINLELKQTISYRKNVNDLYKKISEDLDRHNKNEPKEVEKPSDEMDKHIESKLSSCDEYISEIEELIREKKAELTKINTNITNLKSKREEVNEIINKIILLNESIANIQDDVGIDEMIIKSNALEITSMMNTSIERLNVKSSGLKKEIGINVEDEDKITCLTYKLDEKRVAKAQITSNASNKQQEYQKYLSELKTWNTNKLNLIGDAIKKDTLIYTENEKQYIEQRLLEDYEIKKKDRINLIKEIYVVKEEISLIFLEIYKPIREQLKNIIGITEEEIDFEVNISLSNLNIGNDLLSNVNRNYNGIFYGKISSERVMEKFIKETNFNNGSDVYAFISNVLEVAYEEMNDSVKKIKDKQEFYDTLCKLKYINPEYSLKMNKRSLEELSPGERGIALLFFYLALSKNDMPIIIDQPEDNLDNQSIYTNLVKCIIAAKKKRQVIIVTHNPNIAIACDAEQIIYSSIDKQNNEISYYSGSIENAEIRDKVIDVLEGTKPAFDLRKMKYSI